MKRLSILLAAIAMTGCATSHMTSMANSGNVTVSKVYGASHDYDVSIIHGVIGAPETREEDIELAKFALGDACNKNFEIVGIEAINRSDYGRKNSTVFVQVKCK